MTVNRAKAAAERMRGRSMKEREGGRGGARERRGGRDRMGTNTQATCTSLQMYGKGIGMQSYTVMYEVNLSIHPLPLAIASDKTLLGEPLSNEIDCETVYTYNARSLSPHYGENVHTHTWHAWNR